MMDLLLLTVVSAILGAMLPGAQNNGMKKGFAFLAGLALLLAVFRPIAESVTALADLPAQWMEQILPKEEELEAEEERSRTWVLTFSAQNIEKGVNALIVHRYGLSPDEVESTAEVDIDADGQWILRKMVIRIHTSARCRDAEIAQYIRDILACPCEVQRGELGEKAKGGGTEYGG